MPVFAFNRVRLVACGLEGGLLRAFKPKTVISQTHIKHTNTHTHYIYMRVHNTHLVYVRSRMRGRFSMFCLFGDKSSNTHQQRRTYIHVFCYEHIATPPPPPPLIRKCATTTTGRATNGRAGHNKSETNQTSSRRRRCDSRMRAAHTRKPLAFTRTRTIYYYVGARSACTICVAMVARKNKHSSAHALTHARKKRNARKRSPSGNERIRVQRRKGARIRTHTQTHNVLLYCNCVVASC